MTFPSATERKAPAPDPNRELWLAVRQGLLLIVAAIEKRYNLTRRN